MSFCTRISGHERIYQLGGRPSLLLRLDSMRNHPVVMVNLEAISACVLAAKISMYADFIQVSKSGLKGNKQFLKQLHVAYFNIFFW